MTTFLACVRFPHFQKFFGRQFAEPLVDFAQGRNGHGAARQSAAIDPALDCDVRPGFQLESALVRIRAVVVLHRTLDVDRMRVVAFDEV